MKKYLFISLFAFLNLNIFSQTWQWAVSEPRGSYVTMTSVVITDVYGNSIIGGAGGFTSQAGSGGLFIIKYDPNGNKLWEITYPGDGAVCSLCSDNSGNIYASIYTHTIAGVNYILDNGYIFAKYDSNGNLIWCKQPHGLWIALAERTDAQNNIIATGSVTDAVHLENGYTLTTSSSYGNTFMAKFNTDGECIWALQDDGGNDYINVNQKGEMFIKGLLYIPTSIGKGIHQVTLDPANGRTYCAKYDSIGTLVWVKQILISLMAPDEYGNVYTMEYDINYANTGFLTKYDPTGNLLWKRTSLYLDKSYKCEMTCGINGALFITGGFANYMTIDDTTIYDGVNFHVFVAKIDSSGTLKWITTTNGAGGAGAKDITIANGNEIYITGDIGGGESVFGSHSASQSSGVFAAKLIDAEITGINIKDNPQISFDVYPNPTAGIFQINYSSTQKTNLQLNIIDSKGEKVYEESISQFKGEYKKEINLSKQAKGVYFIEIIADRKREVKRIVLN